MTSTVENALLSVTTAEDAPYAASRLSARTVPLPESVELDYVKVGGRSDAFLWIREQFALAGRGVAMRIVLPSGLDDPAAPELVRGALGAIPTVDEVGRPGCGPVVLAALPFDRTAAAVMTIPAITVGRDATGRRWLTTIGPSPGPVDPLDALSGLAALPRFSPPDTFSLVASRTHEDWMGLVSTAVSAIRAGRFEKVVLAREIKLSVNHRLLPADILRRLHALYPSCMVFSTGTFLGASPELLVSRHGSQVQSHPLAGTVARSGDPAADAEMTAFLLASGKERAEHRFVVRQVAATLRSVCRTLDVPKTPSILSLRNVSHLGTLIDGQLADTDLTALELVARLHPTPAVAGSPTAPAIAFLTAREGFDRGCYSGPVGWMDSRGDGEWAVGVRSAEIHQNTARLFAGVGVVADSDPEAELAETQLKLQALLAAVVRP